MRLSRESSTTVREAIYDLVNSFDELEMISSDCHRPLADITPPTTLPLGIFRLVEDCASRDSLEEFILCMKAAHSDNHLIAALDFSALTEEPADAEIVGDAGGSSDFKQRLTATLAQLDRAGLQELAAGELGDMLAQASDTEARTIYLAVLGNVKVDRPPPVAEALVSVMGHTMARVVGTDRQDSFALDLDRTRLPRVDLGGLDLHEADIAFADLRGANLDGANLRRVKGYAVDISGAGFRHADLEEARLHYAVAVRTRFHDARMVSVFMKDADLTRAEFQQAQMQGAHLERATLNGARFAQANITDAYFGGASIDDEAIASLALAVGWERAHFDPSVHAAVESRHGQL